MTAPSLPVSERILDNVVTILKTVNGPTACAIEPHYFNTFINVTRIPQLAPSYPYLLIRPAGERTDSAMQSSYLQGRVTMRFEILFRDERRTAKDDHSVRLVHDIEKALLFTDARRRQNDGSVDMAEDTFVDGWRPDPVEASSPYVEGMVSCRVIYRQRSYDPSAIS